MTADQILVGFGLIVVLAVGSQVLAKRLRIPALIVLLPAGFTAGALTTDVDPQRLLGSAFSPLVSLAVAVILYDAGLGLDLHDLLGHTKRVVLRLVLLGVPITWAGATLASLWLLGLSQQAAFMLGVILVVSGPTVVGPVLDFVRPVDRLQQVLVWEGSLIDPIGGILGALVFHGVVASTATHVGAGFEHFFAAAGAGAVGGAVGAFLLWAAFKWLNLSEALGTTVQLALVVGIAAFCDAVREDSGLIAAIIMGLFVANRTAIDTPPRRPFFETLVSLILGLLFISISATITPASLHHVLFPAIGLSAVLILVVRPLVAAVSTLRTDLSRGERGLIGWMDPRGIVAASNAATFSAALIAAKIGGAEKVLPATFVVIVVTVVLYGLTAEPVARLLKVVRPTRSRPFLVGGQPWVVDLGRQLSSLGLEVLMWAGLEGQRERIDGAGLDLAQGELLAAATGRRAEFTGITDLLLLTDEDDFNALCSVTLENAADVPVYRLAPPSRTEGVLSPYTTGDVLFGADMNRAAISRRYEAGERIVLREHGGGLPAEYDLLFVVRADGRLDPVTTATDKTPAPGPGDTAVLLGPAVPD